MAPSNPKSAPDAPTDTVDFAWRADNKLPPKPASRYKTPILTAKFQEVEKSAKVDSQKLIRQ